MKQGLQNIEAVEVCLPSKDLSADLEFFTERLGFRLDTIFPADDPAVAVLSAHGLRLRLDRRSTAAPGALRVLYSEPNALAGGVRELSAPNGVRIQIVDAAPRLETPKTQHAFIVSRLGAESPWVRGRAGMQYRDLIPGRLGGAVIASHIRIPDAGPVQDMVHHHDVGFQLIFCHHGWVRLVYEDQGPPFVLKAGDCLIQPPQIRHRVLESSENLQVIEIGTPAEHITTMDHHMELPTEDRRHDRQFGGQRFCLSRADEAVWTTGRLSGFLAHETGIGEATGGVASVRVVRPTKGMSGEWTTHTADILFAFVRSGSMLLRAEGQPDHALAEGDAFVIPPGLKTGLDQCSDDFQLLEVALPADFETHEHSG